MKFAGAFAFGLLALAVTLLAIDISTVGGGFSVFFMEIPVVALWLLFLIFLIMALRRR
ncbi:MAG: hypothetical protein ABSE62_05355 [Chthoniobacteraceae bacterium]|jgi:hypothetical protein